MYLTKFIPALFGAILCASAVGANEPVDYRLPPEIRPVTQSIELRLDPSTPDYSGSTVLQLDVVTDVDRIGIYQVGLDMHAIKLRAGTDERAI